MPNLVSIIIRTKDRPVFLRRALQSISAQSYSHWEIIIVNDGGNTELISSTLDTLPAANRERVRVITNEQSLGRWPSANIGVRSARGDLLVLHDDDDTWAPIFLEKAVTYLATHPDREGTVSRIEIVWEKRDGDCLIEIGREPFLPDSVAPLLMDQQRFNQFVPIAFVYRRSLHDSLGLYDESLPVIGDWVFNSRVLERGALEYLSNEPLAFWHQRPDSFETDGNSVIAARGQHRLHDALLRDDQFRALVAREGAGAALYFERRLRDTEEMIKQQIAMLRHDLTSPVRTGYRRLRRKFTR